MSVRSGAALIKENNAAKMDQTLLYRLVSTK